MNLVLDASAALELALEREAALPLRAILEEADRVLSSELYRVETANALWKYQRAGLIDRDRAFRLQECCLALVDEFVAIAEHEADVLADAIRLDHPCYDLLYLSLARTTGSTLATFDRRLSLLARREGIDAFQ